jgi:molybdopterin-guanine dinucleotide biosynthesis protein A
MGYNKAFIRLDHETIIERAVRVFTKIFSETMIVADDVPAYEGLGLKVFTDIYKGAGSIGGIYTALMHTTGTHAFVVACDMPWLDPDVIKAVTRHASKGEGTSEEFDAAIPFIDGRYHPMHALWSKSCIEPMEEMIKGGELRISRLIERILVKTLRLEDFKGLRAARSVENVNTPDDLTRVHARQPREE